MLNSNKLQPWTRSDEWFGRRCIHNILLPGEQHVVRFLFACCAPIAKPLDLAVLELEVSDEFCKNLGRNVVDIKAVTSIDGLDDKIGKTDRKLRMRYSIRYAVEKNQGTSGKFARSRIRMGR